MKKVYRWESPQGDGPYQDWIKERRKFTKTFHKMMALHNSWKCPRTPAPSQDIPGIWFSHLHRAAFKSVAQANKWFNEKERGTLRANGYKFKELLVKNIFYTSKHQVIIYKEDIIRRKNYDR